MKLLSIIILYLAILMNHTALASQNQWQASYSVKENDENISINYILKRNDSHYDAKLIIQDQQKNTLWNHQYIMTKDDLEGDLLFYENNITVKEWVEHFFDGSLQYGAKFEHIKIKDSEIDLDFLDFYSKKLHLTKSELKNLILSQSIHTVFYYRASWREELVMLVYIPELKKFVHYSGGEY